MLRTNKQSAMQIPQAGELLATHVLITQVFTTGAGISVLIGHCLGTREFGDNFNPPFSKTPYSFKHTLFMFSRQKNLSYQNVGSSRMASKAGGRGEGGETKKDGLRLNPIADGTLYTDDFRCPWTWVHFSLVHLKLNPPCSPTSSGSELF